MFTHLREPFICGKILFAGIARVLTHAADGENLEAPLPAGLVFRANKHAGGVRSQEIFGGVVHGAQALPRNHENFTTDEHGWA